MTRILNNDYNQYVDPSSSDTLHTGEGWIRAIFLFSNNSSEPTYTDLTLYDNTAASGNILFFATANINRYVSVIFPLETPLKFSTGLHAVTDAYGHAYILTET